MHQLIFMRLAFAYLVLKFGTQSIQLSSTNILPVIIGLNVYYKQYALC